MTALIRTHISKKDKTLGRGEKGRRLTGESNLKKVGVEGLFKLRESVCLSDVTQVDRPMWCYGEMRKLLFNLMSEACLSGGRLRSTENPFQGYTF